ncbi:glutamate carboxypeptidase, partial [Pseudomonas putida]
MPLPRPPHAIALALLIACTQATAAQPSPQDLLIQAQGEQAAYLETLKSLVSVDTGTGTEPGLAQVSAALVKRLEALGAQVQ